MLELHAIWHDAALHLWGEHRAPVAPSSTGPNQEKSRTILSAATSEELSMALGDVWDSLLVSSGRHGSLSLRLPHTADNVAAGPLSSWIEPPGEAPAPPDADHAPLLIETSPAIEADAQGDSVSASLVLAPVTVETIAFSPADAVDLLTATPELVRSEVGFGDSVRFWSRAAWLVLELLTQERYVPAIHQSAPAEFQGFWRVVIHDERTAARLRALMTAMPPVCRAVDSGRPTAEASMLVESFLWRSVDALVRRCLEGDELAHTVLSGQEAQSSLQGRFLLSLVGADARVTGPTEEATALHQSVSQWLSRLSPPVPERTCRTILMLHPPEEVGDAKETDQASTAVWRLTIHAQALRGSSKMVAAEELDDLHGSRDPRILSRPFDHASKELRADLAIAARSFPPLAPCAEPDGPWSCSLTQEEVYAFLRDAEPVLKREGFGILLPDWWYEDRPRPRMRLDVRPVDTTVSVGVPALRLDALVAFQWRVAIGDEALTEDELNELAAQKSNLVRLRGRWMEVQPVDVQKALAFLQRNPPGQIIVFEALRRCYLVEDSETGLPLAGLSAHGWVRGLLEGAAGNDLIETLPQPENFYGTLRPYQVRGLSWLHYLSRLGLGACLADDMGLGKTIQLIALLLHERKEREVEAAAGDSGRGPVGPTLLVVPTSLVGNWVRELSRFAPSLRVLVHHGLERLGGQDFIEGAVRHDVVISTYALTHRDFEHLKAVNWHRVALDEAQNIKNPAAKQSQAVRALPCIHRVALTGTPVENRLSELWSIMDFLNPDYMGKAADFRRRFAVPIERYHDQDRASRLRHLIRPFVLRRVKTDPRIQVDLPPKMEQKVFCNLSKEQAALYEAIVGEMLGHIDQSTGIQRRGLILAALVKLKQVCNHPAHFLGDGSSLPRRSGKADRLVEMVEEILAEGDRALIFTQFRVMGDLMQKLLSDAFGVEILFLHGGTPRRQRDSMVEHFQTENGGAPLFILSLKAGGFGLNLTAASHVFHYDRWWNPAVEDQATDRAHRVGQDKPVQVHKFVCAGTLEERIDALLEEKRSLAQNVVGTGEEWVTELSTDQLRDLFALSADAVADD